MKKVFVSVILTIVTQSVNAADWADKWFDNAARTSPSHFKSQQRGYYSAGSYSGRLDLQSDNPISISLPRISSGCGGIDLVLGGFSMLDMEYMGDKLKRVMQAAPAYALDMAMKTLCKECSETMAKLEAATNFLNNLQMDECAMSKRLVATVSRGDPNILGEMWSEMSASASLDGNTNSSWKQAQEKIKDDQEVADLKKLTDGCPAGFKEIFKDGSLIAHAIGQTGVKLSTKSGEIGLDPFVDLMRGYVGDVKLAAKPDDKIPLAQQITPCPQNQKSTLEDMLHGKSYVRNLKGECLIANNKSLLTRTKKRLHALAKNMQGKKMLTDDDIAFVKAVPQVPVYIALRNAIADGDVDNYIENITEMVATSHAWFIFDNLYNHIDYLFTSIDSTVNTPSANAKGKTCDTRTFAPAIAQFEKLHKNLHVNRQQLAVSLKQKMDAFSAAGKISMISLRKGIDLEGKHGVQHAADEEVESH